MAVISFTLNRSKEKNRSFVVGLFWHPLSNKKDFKKETQALASQMKMDLVSWRLGETYQAGLGSFSDGAKAGQLSAAAIVSKTLEIEGVTDFLCATQLPDGRWAYFAQKDGVLLPDGDLGGTEDEIRSRMLGDYSSLTWNTVIAPEHWGFSGAKERDFISFLPQKNGRVRWYKWWELTPIKVGISDVAKKLMPVLILAGVAMLGYAGWNYWEAWQEGKRAEAAAAAAAEAARIEAENRIKPWAEKAPAAYFVDACLKTVGPLKPLPGGWPLRAVECEIGTAKAVWARGTDGMRGAFMREIPTAVVSEAGDFATWKTTFPSGEGRDETLPRAIDAVPLLVDRLAKIGVTVQVKPGTTNEGWTMYTWLFSSPLSPKSLLPYFDQPGTRLNRMAFAMDSEGVSGVWKIEGVLYVR